MEEEFEVTLTLEGEERQFSREKSETQIGSSSLPWRVLSIEVHALALAASELSVNQQANQEGGSE